MAINLEDERERILAKYGITALRSPKECKLWLRMVRAPLYIAQAGRCGLTGEQLSPSELTVDHIIPRYVLRSLGFAEQEHHDLWNLQLVTSEMNGDKGCCISEDLHSVRILNRYILAARELGSVQIEVDADVGWFKVFADNLEKLRVPDWYRVIARSG